MKEVLDKIKSQGYWRINIRPAIVDENKIPSLSDCETIIEKAVVKLRGWPYPLFHHKVRMGRGQNWIQVAEDMKDEIEVWRFYQSGQFVHYLALREDLMDLERIKKMVIPPRTEIKKPVLSLEYTIYTLTEIFEFISRLAQQGIYKEGLEVQIELINTHKRRLFIFDPMRAGFLEEYRTDGEKLSYPVKKISEEEAINNSKDLAMDTILWFIDRFGWKKPSVVAIKDMQQKLLERRL